ncbi:MAG: hypothetical protein JO007_16940 [Alphaproteobacteria bacterium]|nr:hypothetical protein [Alphaproteobacteria bacterium]
MQSIRTLLAVFVITFAAALPASANNRNFILYNQTDLAITGFWTSSYNNAYWWKIDPWNYVQPRRSAYIYFDLSGDCQVQIAIELSDGTKVSWDEGFNLCHINFLTIWMDSNGDYEATGR